MVDTIGATDSALGKHEWFTPASSPDLAVGQVHIWRISLKQPETVCQILSDSLTSDEIARADRFRFDDGRRRFVVGRGILRSILAGYLETKPQEIRFQYGPQGKPSLEKMYENAGLNFNLAHTRDLVVCACTRQCEIGVDVEHIHPVDEIDRIARRIFSEGDYLAWNHLPDELRLTAFYRCWTQKEALIKALGYGLSQPMSQLSVSMLSDEPASLISLSGDREHASDWSLHSFVPETGTIAAFALKTRHWHLAYFVWPNKQVMDA